MMASSSFRILFLIAICACLPAAWAAEPTIQSGGKLPNDNAELRPKAEALAESGRQSLQIYRKHQPGDPNVIIDAAVAFNGAHHLYQQMGDQDGISEMQANLFWCKKQMNLDTLKQYLVRTGKGAPSDSSTPDSPSRPIAPPVPGQTEAEAALVAAKAYADDHPEEISAVAKSFGDLAAKYPGTGSATEAKTLAGDFQAKYDAWIKAGGNLPQTIFTKPMTPKSLDKDKIGLPDEKAWKASVSELKKVFGKEYNRRSNPEKRAFAARLVKEASRARSDAALHYADLIEAVRLAQESEDFALVLDTIDTIAVTFTGVVALDEKKAWLHKAGSRPAANAILTLLDSPRDEAANSLAGRYYCIQLELWKQGLPLLVIGNDAELKTLAELELSRNPDDGERVQVADGWYALSRKTSVTAEKYVLLERAQHWYQRARNIDAVSKSRVQQRLAEIDQILPLDLESLNYDNLAPGQWNKLPGNIFPVPLRVDRSGPLASLKPGQRVRLVPNRDDYTITGELMFKLDKQMAKPAGIVTGPGSIWAIPKYYGEGENRSVVRVKVIPLEDE